MKFIDLNSFSDRLDAITLIAFQAQYRKFSAEYGPRCSAAEYDKRVLALSEAERNVAWAFEVKELIHTYEQKTDVLRFAVNIPLLKELSAAADGIFADAASEMDGRIREVLSEERSFARCDHIRNLYAEFNGADENVKIHCGEAENLKAAYKALDADLALLNAEEEIDTLVKEKSETAAWCERVERMSSEQRDRFAKCRNYDLLERSAKDAAYLRLKLECAEYSMALQKELPYEKVFELDKDIPQHAAALAEVIPSFGEKWAVCLAIANKRADEQAQQWFQQAFTSSPQEKAILLKKAADLGHALACYNVGLCYWEGTGVKKQDDFAFFYFQKAATGGVQEANYYLGLANLYGRGCEKNESQAFRMFQMCAEAPTEVAVSRLALYRLALCYFDGCGVKKDKPKAFALFQTAADKGSAESIYRLGLCYEKGEGVAASEEEALIRYDKAARSGIKEGADAAARLRAVQQKRAADAEAARLARKYADAASAMDGKIREILSEKRSYARCGHIRALYAEFNGIDENVKAVCREANRLKSAYKDLDADGRILHTEEEIDTLVKEKKETTAWCERVINLQSTVDSAILSKCTNYATFSQLLQTATATRYKIQREMAEALDKTIDACYERANKGDADAQLQLAEYYFTGHGVTRSYQEAFLWFRKAAKKGNKQAMTRVGDCYYYGYGVEQSYPKAEKWYNKAIK